MSIRFHEQLVSGQLDLWRQPLFKLKAISNAKASTLHQCSKLTASSDPQCPLLLDHVRGQCLRCHWCSEWQPYLAFTCLSLRRKIYPYSLYDSFCRCSCFWFDCTILGALFWITIRQLIWSLQVRSCLLYRELP